MNSAVRIPLSALAVAGVALVAAGLRTAVSADRPLDNHEAAVALRAAEASDEASAFWTSTDTAEAEPGYSAPTSILFTVLGANEAAARAIPALAGTLLALTPLLLWRELGWGRALLASFLLSVSPIVVAASREAGGAALAALGVSLVFAAWARASRSSRISSAVLAAAGLGLALAAGRSGWMGIAGIVIGFTIARLIGGDSGRKILESVRGLGSRLWLAPAIALLIAGGAGLSLRYVPDLFTGLGVWLQGWTAYDGMDAAPAVAALVLYEPLILLTGLFGIGLALRARDPLRIAAGGWMAGALLNMAVYSARRPEDLIFVLVPLSLTAASTILDGLERVRPGEHATALVGLMGVLTVLAGFSAVQLAAYGHGQGPAFASLTPGTSLALGLGAIAVMALVVFLFGAGWSYAVAAQGAGLAALAIASAFSLSAVWGLNIDPRGAGAGELIRPQASTPSLPLLASTLEKFSQASTGRTDAMPIDMQGNPPPALAWALRRFPRATPVSVANTDQPLVVLAPENDLPALGADYLGQVFTVADRWNWIGVLPADLLVWMVRREAPLWPDNWLLLLRADLASLGEAPADSGAPAP